MGKIAVSVGPLSNRIFAGTLLKDGRTYGANKCDVTEDAVGAAAIHLLQTNKTFEFTTREGKTYHMKVVEVKE